MIVAQFSYNYSTWAVYNREYYEDFVVGLKFLWPCKTEVDAEKLAVAMNTGKPICRGAKELGNNCGHCAKCRYVG